MTTSEAKRIAFEYADKMGEVLPGYKLGIGDHEDFSDRFYFDFVFLTIEGLTPLESPVAGGARGLTIDKNSKQIKLATHADYSSLLRRQVELHDTYEFLQGLKNGKGSLIAAKEKYNLSSEQLLEFLKALEIEEFSRDDTFKVLTRFLQRSKNYPQ